MAAPTPSSADALVACRTRREREWRKRPCVRASTRCGAKRTLLLAQSIGETVARKGRRTSNLNCTNGDRKCPNEVARVQDMCGISHARPAAGCPGERPHDPMMTARGTHAHTSAQNLFKIYGRQLSINIFTQRVQSASLHTVVYFRFFICADSGDFACGAKMRRVGSLAGPAAAPEVVKDLRPPLDPGLEPEELNAAQIQVSTLKWPSIA